MAKLGERWFADDGKLVRRATYDAEPALIRAKQLRDADKARMGEVRPIGTVPGWLMNEWIKEAGLRWDDTQAVEDLLFQKLTSGDFSKLAAFEGRLR